MNVTRVSSELALQNCLLKIDCAWNGTYCISSCLTELVVLSSPVHPMCNTMGMRFKSSVLYVDLITHAVLIEAGFIAKMGFGQSAASDVFLKQELPYFSAAKKLQA